MDKQHSGFCSFSQKKNQMDSEIKRGSFRLLIPEDGVVIHQSHSEDKVPVHDASKLKLNIQIPQVVCLNASESASHCDFKKKRSVQTRKRRSDRNRLLDSNNEILGSTTLFPLPPLTATIDLLDVKFCSFQNRKYCSNCYSKISDGGLDRKGKRFADILCDKRTRSGKGLGFGVTVLEALDVIFELNRKSFLSQIILDEVEYLMCFKCCSMLSKLFQLYLQFTGCAKHSSYIKAIIKHNKTLVNRLKKEKLQNASQTNFEVDAETNPPLKCEVSFLEEDDSYVPSSDYRDISNRRQLKKRKYALQKDENCDSKFAEVWPVSIKKGRGRPRKCDPHQSSYHTNTKAPSTQKHDRRKEKDRRLSYKCDECYALFSRPCRLQRHRNVHSRRKYICKNCNAGFKFLIYLERHEAVQHKIAQKKCNRTEVLDKPLKRTGTNPIISVTSLRSSRSEQRRAHVCRDCGLVFTTSAGLRRHFALHKGCSNICNVPGCTADFVSINLLNRHKMKAHNMETTKIFQQSKVSRLSRLQRRFLRKNNVYTRLYDGKRSKKYQCPQCPQMFHRIDNVTRHVVVHAVSKHICKNCEAGFVTLKKLQEHIKMTHEVQDSTIIKQEAGSLRIRVRRNCPESGCTYSFTRTNHLKQHLQSKHKIMEPTVPLDEPRTCPVCNLVFRSQGRLDLHLQRHRPLVRENNYKCDICGKKYRDANNLRNHKACHGLSKPFICDKCGFATKRSYQLTRHIEMVHVGTRSHSCKECELSFKKKQHLLDHIMTHKALEYRPYACTSEGCTKAYRSKRNLRQHLEAHANCKFQCETCGRIFTRKDNLKVHVDTVHLGKPGRTQKEKVKVDGGTAEAKRIRKRKKTTGLSAGVVGQDIEIMSSQGGPQHELGQEAGQNHQVMIVEEANIHHLQHHPQFQLLTDAQIIQQGSIASQNLVTIPNPFGEFFYTL